ncbi:hypothetical protein C8Z91_34805 [Paenibacillus elgii]|uniref:Nucleotidyltransferase family protein n=1 Tax=Paenibacillus elgii TaxID=189691 RepID=A0A2T6FRV6_9BACL|nr:nucleotidyltransferase family protein [Paenibacillus elgii]PUA34638.1 hypothetical protein C8Z91_34805 [Paenibacillus elgii]
MKEIFQLRLEEELLLLTSRVSLTADQEERVKSILNSKEFDMTYLLNLCIRHKVLPLVGQHLIRLDNFNINTQYKRLIDYAYLGNKQRNIALFNELKKLLMAFKEKNIIIIPLKGTVLAPNVYKDIGLRTLSDLDFLIRTDQRDFVSNLLKSQGYIVGYYDWSSNDVYPTSRKKELMWKMYNGNLYPHMKLLDDPFVRFCKVDFSYDIDLKRTYHASNKLLDKIENGAIQDVPCSLLNPIDMLIHITIHLFKEASNVHYVHMHKELNLIKFVDLREYTLRIWDNLNPKDLIKRAIELESTEALFYCFYYLNLLYKDHFSEIILNELNLKDTDFLYKYGHKDYDKPKSWQKSFVDRFFSLSNLDEIEEDAKYIKRKEELM